jgi:hypothetical protein
MIPTGEMTDLPPHYVMAGLGPAIHVFADSNRQDVDGRPAPAMTIVWIVGYSFGRLA